MIETSGRSCPGLAVCAGLSTCRPVYCAYAALMTRPSPTRVQMRKHAASAAQMASLAP